MSNNVWVHRQNPTDWMGRDTLLCLLLGPGCLYILVYVVGSETVSLPVNLVRSQMNQIEVAFVFGTDDELLYVYEADGDPWTKFSQAIRPLQHPLRSEGDSENTTIGERLAEYIAEARQRRKKSGTRSASRTSRASSRIFRPPKASMQESSRSRKPSRCGPRGFSLHTTPERE